MIVSEDGYILTNNHVIDGAKQVGQLLLAQGRLAEAENEVRLALAGYQKLSGAKGKESADTLNHLAEIVAATVLAGELSMAAHEVGVEVGLDPEANREPPTRSSSPLDRPAERVKNLRPVQRQGKSRSRLHLYNRFGFVAVETVDVPLPDGETAEVGDYVKTAKLETVRLTQGEAASSVKTSAPVAATAAGLVLATYACAASGSATTPPRRSA